MYPTKCKKYDIVILTKKEANQMVYDLYKSGMAYGLEDRLYRVPELFTESMRASLLSIDGKEVEFDGEVVAYQVVSPFKFHNIKGLKDGKEI